MRLKTLMTLLLFAGTPGIAHGSALDFFGFGARGMAMGNAHVGVANDASANHYNPAGLAWAEDIRIDVHYTHTLTSLRINNADLDVDENSGLMAGVVVPGDLGPVRFAFGLGLYLPNARLSRIRALPEFQPRFVYLDNRTQHLAIAANLAFQPIESLTIGGGLHFLTDTGGQVQVTGTLYPEPERGELVTAADVDFETARFPAAGITYAPRDDLQFGLAYRGEMKVTLDLGARVLGEIRELLGSQALEGEVFVSSYNTNFFSPHQVFAGVAWWPIPQTLLALDIGWLHWSAFPTPTADVFLNFDLPPFDTEGLIPETTPPSDPGFHDVYSIRFGVEHQLDLGPSASLILRGGYSFEPSPAPTQRGRTNYVDTDKHMVSAGLSTRLFVNPKGGEHPLQIDLAVQHIFFPTTTTEKDNPADPIGDYSADGNIWSFTASARFLFPW